MTNQTVNAEIMKKFHIDHENQTIVMPKNIAKRASIYRTDRDVTQIDIILETIFNRIHGNSIDFSKLEEE